MPRIRHKKAQKESLLYQEISKFFLAIALDDERVRGLSLTRIKLSDDGGSCIIFFYAPGGLKEYEQKRAWLILYKPSLRKALSRTIAGRYTPNLVFKYDDEFEKQQRLEQIFDTIKES
jgi:ribosome-binding factor A